ncbi:MAG: Pam3-gp28 family putative phage holin [Caldimonas sp.]
MDLLTGMIGKIGLGVLRHTMTTAAGGMVAKGLLTNDQSSALVGAVLTLAGIALSVYDKLQAAKAAGH